MDRGDLHSASAQRGRPWRSRLLGLTVHQMVRAFGIYGAFAPLPSAKQWNWDNRPLSWTKDMVAWPSMAGINAALLAESGFLAPSTIFEGEKGFFRMAGLISIPRKHWLRGSASSSTSFACTSNRTRAAAGPMPPLTGWEAPASRHAPRIKDKQQVYPQKAGWLFPRSPSGSTSSAPSGLGGLDPPIPVPAPQGTPVEQTSLAARTRLADTR